MKNRAKCKLCSDILESFHRHDFVTCKCGEISVDGGNDYYKCSARNWDNFLRIDDQGNEIIVKVKDDSDTDVSDKTKVKEWASSEMENTKPLTREDRLKELDRMILSIEGLPEVAMTTPVNQYDLLSALILLSEILRKE